MEPEETKLFKKYPVGANTDLNHISPQLNSVGSAMGCSRSRMVVPHMPLYSSDIFLVIQDATCLDFRIQIERRQEETNSSLLMTRKPSCHLPTRTVRAPAKVACCWPVTTVR